MIQAQIMINSELKHLEMLRGFIIEAARRANFPPEKENRIVLAVDEAVANIIEHGYQLKREGYIDIKIKIDKEKFEVNIRDNGRSFNPDLVEKPNIIKWIKEGRKKGLGIFLIKQVMDEVKYTFKTGQNRLLLVKYIKGKRDKKVKGV